MRLWDPVTGTPVGEPLAGHTGWVTSVAFGPRPDGRLLLASGSGDGTVRLWDPVTGAASASRSPATRARCTSVAFGTTPDGRLLLASGSDDKTVRLWDMADKVCVLTLRRRSSVRSVAISGALLAIGDEEGVSVIELQI